MKAALDCSQVDYISFILLGLEGSWCCAMHDSYTLEAQSQQTPPVQCSLACSMLYVQWLNRLNKFL